MSEEPLFKGRGNCESSQTVRKSVGEIGHKGGCFAY